MAGDNAGLQKRPTTDCKCEPVSRCYELDHELGLQMPACAQGMHVWG